MKYLSQGILHLESGQCGSYAILKVRMEGFQDTLPKKQNNECYTSYMSQSNHLKPQVCKIGKSMVIGNACPTPCQMSFLSFICITSL